LLPGHDNIISSAENELSAHPGIFLAGNYLSGVGMEYAVMNGYLAFEKCISFLESKDVLS
jgi:protoporphyrinogen oxidase